jgi:hypothetical protein
MTPDASLPSAFSLPERTQRLPCSELAPFAKDERIWWAFACAAKASLKQTPNDAAAQLVQRLQTWSVKDALTFAQAYQRGAVVGSIEAVDRYYDDLVKMVRAVLLPVAELFDATFDPQMYAVMSKFYGAPPGSDEQADALAAVAAYLSAEYPAFAEALRAIAMATVAIQAVVEWIKTDVNAVWTIAMAISSALGKVLGEEAA